MAAQGVVGGNSDQPVLRDSLQAFHLQGDVHVLQGLLGEINAGVALPEEGVQEVLVQEFPPQADEPLRRLFPELAAEDGTYVDGILF